MSRVIRALLVLTIALTPIARSQTSTPAEPKNPAVPQSTTGGADANPKVEDCACESPVLPEVLATVNGVTITSKDIKKATADSVSQLQRQVIDARKRELDLIINSKLLAVEAKRLGISTTKLLEQEIVAKIKRPTLAEAQAFYNQNSARIKEEFKAVAEDIIQYLLDQRQRTEAKRFADGLRAASDTKVYVTEVIPPASEEERARVVATIKGETITAGDVEESLRPMIFEVQERVYKLRKAELELNINDTLLTQEAQKRKITINALLDAEVKPKPVTDDAARAFYEENKDRVSGDFDQSKEAIRRYLEQIELRQAQRAFVDKLRATASIDVFLVPPESPVFSISTADQPSLGNADAPVTIVAFTDYQCSSCAVLHPALERLVKEYGDKVRLVTRDFPLSQHPEAFKAAEAAEAARDQGKYWEYVQILMRNQSALSVEKLKGYASELALDRSRFDAALDSGKFSSLVERDIEDGMKLRINATPTVFVNGRRVPAKDYDELKASIEAAFKVADSKTAAGLKSTQR